MWELTLKGYLLSQLQTLFGVKSTSLYTFSHIAEKNARLKNALCLYLVLSQMKNCLKADAKASAFEFLSIKISSVIKISKGRICRKHQNSINIKILKASRNLGTGYSCKANCKNGFRMRISRRWRFTEKVPQTQCLSGFAGFLHWLQNRVPRVQVLLPLPKYRTSHFVVSCFFYVKSRFNSR